MKHAVRDRMKARLAAIAELRPAILAEGQSKYGTERGPAGANRWLPRNNRDHWVTVESYAVSLELELAKKGETDPEHVAIVQLGALVHDVEQDLGTHEFGPDPSGGANERASGERGVQELRGLIRRHPGLFHERDMRLLTEAVGATTVEITDDAAIQSVGAEHIMGAGGGQFRVEQEVMADADLSMLGRRHGLYDGLTLYAQKLANRGLVLPERLDGLVRAPIDPQYLLDFMRSQQDFFRNRVWYRPESAARLNEQRDLNVLAFVELTHRIERDLDSGLTAGAAFVNAVDAALFYRVYLRLPEDGEVAPRDFPAVDTDLPVAALLGASSGTEPLADGRLVDVRHAGVVITDMVNSVAHQAGMSPREAAVFEHEHSDLLSRAVARHGGRLLSNRGDGFLFTFDSAQDAVDGAVSMQRAIKEDNASRGREVGIRIGVCYGEVALTSESASGRPVHEASRLCYRVAEGGEVAVTRAALDEATGDTIAVTSSDRTVDLPGLGKIRVRVLKP